MAAILNPQLANLNTIIFQLSKELSEVNQASVSHPPNIGVPKSNEKVQYFHFNEVAMYIEFRALQTDLVQIITPEYTDCVIMNGQSSQKLQVL